MRVREMFQTLGDVAKKTNTGVALLIDEAQALPDRDLDLLVRVLDNLYSYPVAVILAGLPGIPAKLSKDETTGADTWFRDLSPLSAKEAVLALAGPIRNSGGVISEVQLRRMAEFSQGHPLTLRMLGVRAWESAWRDNPGGEGLRIGSRHVTESINSVAYQLMVSHHEPTWMRCNAVERQVLGLLAAANDEVTYYSFISSHWRNVSEIENVLYALMGKGVVSRGVRPGFRVTDIDPHRIYLAIPGFRRFVELRNNR